MTARSPSSAPFGDALDFILTKREGPGGAQVGGGQLLPLLREQLELAGAAIAVAIVVGLPIGLWLGHTRRGSFLASPSTNVGRAVPSIGVVFLFFAALGAGFLNIMLALVLLAIPPILTNAYTGVREVEPDVVDAARGDGPDRRADRAPGRAAARAAARLRRHPDLDRQRHRHRDPRARGRAS